MVSLSICAVVVDDGAVAFLYAIDIGAIAWEEAVDSHS